LDAGSLTHRPSTSAEGVRLSGRYEVVGLLGAGSQADVYRVRDLASGEVRALKALRNFADPAAVLAFRREFLLLNRLRHPAMVEVFEFETLADGRPAFTAEIIAGRGLGEVAPLAGGQAQAVVLAIAQALDHLHRAGLVHCDLKPENAALLDEGSVKLLDLGLAQAPGEGRAGGTPAYMAPEVARGAPADPRADLYSLGALGYFLLTGRPPHPGNSAAEVLAEALRSPAPPLPDTAPPDLARVVMALLAKDPASRPPMSAILAALGHQAEARSALPERIIEPGLVGRQSELANVGAKVDAALAGGRLAVIRVAGPAGIGKDRLLAEFRALRQAGGARVVAARCSSGGAAYHPFDEALRALGVDPDPPWAGAREAASSRSALLAASTSFFGRLAKDGPVVIHLADWHHADRASEALLAHMEKVAPEVELVFVVSVREGTGENRISIKALGPEDVRDAAIAMLGGVSLDPSLSEELHRLSEGNPLFLSGILGRSLALGLLGPGPDGWKATMSLAQHALPANLAEALTGRLVGLSDAALAVARTMAVLAHPAGMPLLIRATALAPDEFAAALDALEAANVVLLQADGAVAFAQAAMGEALLGTLTNKDLDPLRQRIVLALEHLVADDARDRDPVVVEDLARHAMPWDPGGRGIRYGLAAARAHLRVYAVDRAREFLEQGLAYIEGHAAEVAATRLAPAYQELLGDAYRHAGAFGSARTRYKALSGTLPDDDPRLPRILASLGLACQSMADYEEAMSAFDRSLAAADRLAESSQALRALTSIARLAYLTGDMEKAAVACQRAVDAAQEADSQTYLGESLALIGFLMVAQDPATAKSGLAKLEEALALRKKAGDPVALADSLMFLGNAQMTAGRPLEALKTFSENLQICRESGAAAEDALTAMLNIALARLDLGAFQEAALGASEAKRSALEAGSTDLVVYAQAIEAVGLAQTGRLAPAFDLLGQALGGARALESQYLEAAALAIGAEAHLVVGSALQARDDLVKARTLAAEAGTEEFTARILALQAEACLALSEFDEARQALDALESLARKLGTGAPLARWAVGAAELERRLGEQVAAEGRYSKALEVCEQHGMAHGAARASLGRGQARSAQGKLDSSRADLLAAQRTAARLSCPHLLVDALLALAQTTFDPGEADRYREMAEGHLGPLLSGLSPSQRARYLAAAGRDAARGKRGNQGGATLPPELESLVPFLDRPLRDLLARAQNMAESALPVGDLVGKLLEARPDPDQVLQRTLEIARDRFGAERAMAVNRMAAEFEVRAMIPKSEDLLRFSRTFINMALEQDRTLWTVDALADPRLSATESVSRLEMRAIACTPVRVAGSAVGALYLDWSDPSGGLSDAGKREFEVLAGLAGVCLFQAELNADLAQRTERLEIMNDLADALAHTLEVDALLEMALRHSLTISDAQVGCVLAGADLAVRIARDREGVEVAEPRVSNTVRERVRKEQAAFALIDSDLENLSASVAAEGLRSVMAVPIRVEDELRGAFYLSSGVSARGFTPRDLALLEAVANQVGVALGRVDLVNELANRERMRRELEIARDVQKGLFPKRLPKGDGYTLAAASVPALEVGGDFYDVFKLPDGRVGLFIGDVAGKGVPAALLMASLLSGFRAVAPSEPDPAEVLARLNDLLIAQRASSGVFASALYAVYDPRSRLLVWSCAGHTPPLVHSADLVCEGPVLGLIPGMTFNTESRKLDPGAVLAFYTDGLEDAKGPADAVAARSDLEDRFARLVPGSAEDIANALFAIVETVAGENVARYDDVTILVLSIQG
jgi:serine phosphatase RsbU (regulator of sigma subunit)/tetratricopeptide (TPR) repeat protein